MAANLVALQTVTGPSLSSVDPSSARTALRPFRGLSRFGFFLGLAFQDRDDLLDTDELAVQGKSPLGDIRAGKHTLLMIHLVRTANAADQVWLKEFLADPDSSTTRDCAHVLELMSDDGSIDFVAGFAQKWPMAARDSFSRLSQRCRNPNIRGFFAN